MNKIGYDLSKDMELKILVDRLDVKPGDKILELGCVSEPLSLALERIGCEAWGIDIRDKYDWPLGRLIIGDFLDVELPEEYFDIIIDVSAIHHFGLPNPYGDELDYDADIKTAEKVWRLLKPNGRFYLSMDRFKRTFDVIVMFVRQYDDKSFRERIAKNFKIEIMETFTYKGERTSSGDIEILFALLRKEAPSSNG